MLRLSRVAKLMMFALALLCGSSLFSQTAPRFVLTTAEVATALVEAGLRVEAKQIEMPVVSTAGTVAQPLHITAAEVLPDGRLRARVACEQPKVCQPFMVLVREETSTSAFRQFVNTQNTHSASPRTQGEASGYRVVAGQHATLVLEDKHMRITVPVLVIDTGSLGSAVRVSSLDRKQIFNGTVENAAVVRGSLP